MRVQDSNVEFTLRLSLISVIVMATPSWNIRRCSVGVGLVCVAVLLTSFTWLWQYDKRPSTQQCQKVAAILMEFRLRASTNKSREFKSDLVGTQPGEGWEMDAYSAGDFGAYVTWKEHRRLLPTHLTYHILQDRTNSNVWVLSQTRSPVPSAVAGGWSKWINYVSWMNSTKHLLSVTNYLASSVVGE